MDKVEELQNRLDLLLQFGGVVYKETRLDRLLELIAAQVKKILNCDRCTVFILDKKTNELWSKVAQGIRNSEIRMPGGKGIAGEAAGSGRTINIRDAYKDPLFNPEIDRMTGYQTRTILAVPLKDAGGNIIGVFQAINKNKGCFDHGDEGVLRLISSIAASAIENAQLYERLYKAQLETIYRLAITAEYRDQEDTAVHLKHVSAYTALIAGGMGLSEQETENIRYASQLHDIGKVAIPDAILLKPSRLDPVEFVEMKKHALYGGKILCDAESELLNIACQIAQSHHEKFDGTGYPAGAKGEEIPLYARIMAVADVFDALCMHRVYKPAWTPEQARAHIRAESGKAFDPAVVAGFEKVFEELVKIR
ncbi:MAG: HD domain-containing phosphohydrolase [Elusimicrobiales bacterium]|jgi:HD-GYP domain-containing protein (c-di-GMP phosphodiesterase class II)